MVDFFQVIWSILQTLYPYITPLGPTVVAIFLAWYVYSWLVDRKHNKETDEKRLKELYRPMEMILRASKLALERHKDASLEEKEFIQDLWAEYDKTMKSLMLEKSHLFLEPNPPVLIDELLLAIDSFLYRYKRHKANSAISIFQGAKDFPFPDEANAYFASTSAELARRLRGRRRVNRGTVMSRFRRLASWVQSWPIRLQNALRRH